VASWLAWLFLSRGPKARICTISYMRTRMLWHETYHPGPDAYPHTATIFIQVFILIQDIRRCWDSWSKYTCNTSVYGLPSDSFMMRVMTSWPTDDLRHIHKPYQSHIHSVITYPYNDWIIEESTWWYAEQKWWWYFRNLNLVHCSCRGLALVLIYFACG
jgi:hypothetical protein